MNQTMHSSLFNKTASWFVLGLFGVILALSFLVPIYTDEITIKITRVQVLFDAFKLTSLFPQCGAEFALSVPLIWAPGVLIDRLIYGNVTAPIFVRIVGVLMLVTWLGMLAWFMRRNVKAEISSLHLIAGLISLVSLGVLPFLLVLNRSEQVLFVGITFISILPSIVVQNQPKSNWVWAILAVMFCLAISYMFSSHPKTFFFIPLMIVSALHLSVDSRRVWIGVILLGGLGAICYESLTFWNRRMYCPDAPFLDAILKSHSLSVGLLLTSPMDFFHAGLDNLIHSKDYLKNIVFQTRYQSDWLPFSMELKLDKFTMLINVCVRVIYVVCFGYFVVLLAKRLHSDWLERKLIAQTTISAALLFGIVSTSFFMISKNFYESSLILPLVFLLFVLLLPALYAGNPPRKLHSFLFSLILMVSIASQVNLLRKFTSYLAFPLFGNGQITEQGLSVSSSGYAQVREKVVNVAAQCGIKVGDLNSHLVIDDSTYFPFNDAYRPFHALFVTGFWGKDIGDNNFFQFLKENKSAGVIASCDHLPSGIRKFTKEQGGFCCISQQDINMLGSNIQTPGK